jgi:hypothetical protein
VVLAVNKISLVELKANAFDLNIGVGVETRGDFKDGSVDLHVIGCGFTVCRKVSISVFGGSFGIDPADCFSRELGFLCILFMASLSKLSYLRFLLRTKDVVE